MTEQRRAKELFLDAVARAPAERARYVVDACGSDLPLRQRVEELLDAHEAAGRFLVGSESPSAEARQRTGNATIAKTVESSGGIIGRYKLLQRIGEGGFGEVWMAEQTEPVLRRVAVKIIKPGMDSRQVIARFEAERQALAMMDHPNIARVLDAGATDSGRPYFVMELVRGEPITQYCDRERLTVSARLEIFRNVCNAVQHAHQKGIIHRDLKPSNVLVTVADAEPLPKVIDFGIAKAIAGRLTDKTLFTEHRALIGTPAYMSPEQAEMSGVDIDTRSDIYALGVLLYELLAGGTPLEGQRLRSAPFAEMQRIIREEEPPRPSFRLASLAASSGMARLHTPIAAENSKSDSSILEIAQKRRSDPTLLTRSIRGDLDWIVMKCLEKDRRRRYETASALADDLGRYLDDQPVVASPPRVGYRLGKFVRRNRGAVIAGTLMITTLLIAAGISIAFGISEARQSRAAERAVRELEQVVHFQENQLSDVDAQAMGARLRAELLERVRAAGERSKLAPEALAARMAELDTLLAGSDFTGLALETLDGNFFAPALSAIHEQFLNQPVVEARLLQTSAATLRQVGLLDAASAPQETALTIRRRELGNESPDTLDSVSNMGALLQAKGRLAEAEALYREALSARRRVLGEEHRDTLTSINQLGSVLMAQGRLEEAESFFVDALEKRRRTLGDDDEETLNSINNLGLLRQTQGRLAEAEPLYQEALEKSRRILGNDHPHTISSLLNMGYLLREQGELEQAVSYYREALERSQRVLGNDHPTTLTALSSMGTVLQDQGQLVDAESTMRDTLERSRRVLGDAHPETLTAIANLGVVLVAEGKLDEAEQYYQGALDESRRVLGEEHFDTIRSIYNMACFLKADGRLKEAETYYREALAKAQMVLGDDHSVTLDALNGMGSILEAEGRYADAESYRRTAWEGRRRVLGDDHPATLESLFGIGSVLRLEGKLEEAEQFSRAAMEQSRKILGDDHPDTLRAIGNMGLVLRSEGKFAQAEAYYRESLEKRQRLLGDDHVATLTNMHNLASLLLTEGKYAEAEPYYRQVFATRRRLLSEDHPDLLVSINHFGRLLMAQGKLAEAEPYCREALEKYRSVLGDEHPETLVSVITLGRLLQVQGQATEAIELLTPAEPAVRAAFSRRDHLAGFLTALGRARVPAGEYAPAEANLKEAWAILQSAAGASVQQRTDVLMGFVELYDAWHAAEPAHSHDAQAAVWRTRLLEQE